MVSFKHLRPVSALYRVNLPSWREWRPIASPSSMTTQLSCSSTGRPMWWNPGLVCLSFGVFFVFLLAQIDRCNFLFECIALVLNLVAPFVCFR